MAEERIWRENKAKSMANVAWAKYIEREKSL